MCVCTSYMHDILINVEDEIIECSSSVKLLWVNIDNKLNFDEHVSKLCKKASQKIHALARISNCMSQDKLCIIMSAFIESQFGYCPLVWMFHSRALNNRFNRLHERALRLVYKDPVFNGTETVAFQGTKNIGYSTWGCKKKSVSLIQFKEKIKNWEPKIR